MPLHENSTEAAAIAERSAAAHSDPHISHIDYIFVMNAFGCLVDDCGEVCIATGKRRLALLRKILLGEEGAQ